jgi:iron only hydrogenase large subunit-like protein
MQQFVSHAKTPMHYCAEIIKEKYPNAKTVFIGPCIAKRYEALNNDLVDYVITFEELDALFSAKDIDVKTSKAMDLIMQPKSHSRGYATSCGVTAAMLENAGKNVDLKPVFINGLDRKGLIKLKAFAKKMDGNFLEVMACEGGCVGGPCTIVDK